MNYKGSTSYRTSCGGFLSILFGIVVLAFIAHRALQYVNPDADVSRKMLTSTSIPIDLLNGNERSYLKESGAEFGFFTETPLTLDIGRWTGTWRKGDSVRSQAMASLTFGKCSEEFIEQFSTSISDFNNQAEEVND